MDRGYKGRRPVPRPASWGRAREEWKRLLREWKPSWNFRYSRVLAGNRKSFSVAALFKINGDVLNRFAPFINEANAEIAHAGAIDDRATNDVPAFIDGEAFGNAVIHHHAPITGKDDSLLAVEPPHRCRIGTYSHANSPQFPGAVDDGHGPEEDTVGRFVHCIGEAKELDVELRSIQRMPNEFLAGNGHLVAIARDHGRLVWEVLVSEGLADVGVSKSGIRSEEHTSELQSL